MTVILCTDLKEWVLSLHSPSAMLRSNTISQRGTLMHVWALVFVARENCVPGSHGRVAIRETFLYKLVPQKTAETMD